MSEYTTELSLFMMRSLMFVNNPQTIVIGSVVTLACLVVTARVISTTEPQQFCIIAHPMSE